MVVPRKALALALLLAASCCGEVDARRRDKGALVEQHGAKLHATKAHAGGVPPVTASDHPASDPVSAGQFAHGFLAVVHAALLLYCMLLGSYSDRPAAFRRASAAVFAIFALEGAAHMFAPLPHLSVGVMIFVAVVFTISPIEDETRPISLHMGTVPPLCVLWLGATRIMSHADLVTALYGTESLRPYHLVVMFLGSVYLCTALERSGFLHTAASKVVEKYGRSPWGLFWALGCFSACLTVLIPDDIVTMTLTPITIKMCQLLNLPEIPYLFSQFFAGNIWAVTLVTGNPTNVLLAEDLGDSFVSFAGRMGIPGIAAGLTSFFLMYLTNRSVVNSAAESSSLSTELRGLSTAGSDSSSDDRPFSPGEGEEEGRSGKRASREDEAEFTRHGVFCLFRVLTATLICALESFHGLPVYLVVLIMGVSSFMIDVCISLEGALDVLRHMPWELFSFVTGFLVLAEAMSITGVSLWLASAFLPFAHSRSVAYVSGFTTMLFCNVFETLPATLIVFKMIDSVPQWKPEHLRLAGGALKDARRAALSAVIFGSNFGANTACIGSLGGLMMRRLALQQGVTVTNGMLLRQGIPVMIPTMLVACYVLIHQEHM